MDKLISNVLECARLKALISEEISKGLHMNIDYVLYLECSLNKILNKKI